MKIKIKYISIYIFQLLIFSKTIDEGYFFTFHISNFVFFVVYSRQEFACVASIIFHVSVPVKSVR